MKKLSLVIAIITLCVSFSACSNADLKNESSESPTSATAEPSVSATDEPEKSEESSEESKEESSEESKDESKDESSDESSEQSSHVNPSNLPQVQGNDEFVKAFNTNEIDKIYAEEMSKAATTTAMIEAVTNASSYWERDLSFVYTELMDELKDEDRDLCEMQQAAWINDLPIALDEIREKYSEDGTLGKYSTAFDIMVLYRTRAAELHAQIFEKLGTVEFAPSESEVVG